MSFSALQAATPAQTSPGTRSISTTAHDRVEVHADPAEILPLWHELLSVAAASPYQTPGFILPWLATLGNKDGIRPMFVVMRDEHGAARALFCFGLKHIGPLRAALFLGGRDSNFNFGLFRPSFTPGPEDILALLQRAAAFMGREKPDLFLLLNQPTQWNGWQNPLAGLPQQASPSFAYATTLRDDPEAFFSDKLSKDTRKKLRKKEQRLQEIGAVRPIADPDDPALRQAILDCFFAQKVARFETQGIKAAFDDPAMRAFADLATEAERGADGRLELHALACGEKIVAVYGGATHQGHFSAYFNSFDADPEIAKSSPGDLLLLKLAAAKGAAGLKSLDLGIGEARYKKMLCDDAIPLFDSFVGVTWKGRLAAAIFSSAQKMKRRIKQNPEAFAMLRTARARLSRKSP